MKTILLGLLPLRPIRRMPAILVIGALAVSAAVMFMGWYSNSSRTTATLETTSSIKPQSTVLEGLTPQQIEMLKARGDAPVAEPTPKKKKWAE